MKIRILDQAEEDLISGSLFYEAQQAGLGAYFRERLMTEIDSLADVSGVHRVVYREFHRALSKRFPFAIFYTSDHETVYIEAIVDCRRQPSWIKRRLRDS